MTGKKNMYREVYRHTLMEEGAQGVRHIRSDESGVDRIVEGFRRRGIYENVIKDC